MILEKFNLTNKVAIVTGCKTGLGQGIAIGLAEAGANIVGIDYLETNETEEKIKKTGRKYLGITADLTSIDPLNDIIKSAVNEFNHIDILVP